MKKNYMTIELGIPQISRMLCTWLYFDPKELSETVRNCLLKVCGLRPLAILVGCELVRGRRLRPYGLLEASS